MKLKFVESGKWTGPKIYTCGVGSESPDGSGGEQIPVVLGLEELSQPLLVPVDAHDLVLDVLGEALLQWLCDHGQLVLLVRGLGETLQGARLDDCLAEGDDGVGDLDVDLGVQLAQVVHDAVEVELAGPEDDVLTALLNLCLEERVALVDLTQAVQHLGELGGVHGLDCDLDDRLSVELERPEDVELLVGLQVGDGRRLDHVRVDPLDENPVAGGHAVDLDLVAGLIDP